MSLLQEPANPLPLRDYQQVVIEKLRQSLREGHRRPCVKSPCGTGKTRISGEIFKMAREKDKRVVFCVPRIDLIGQTLRSFWRDGITDIGVIQASHPETDWSRPVQVASVDTLRNHGYPAADLVIWDECHVVKKFMVEWMAHPEWQKVPFIGLSATPWAKGMAKVWDDLIIVATIEDMIAQGYQSEFRVFAPSRPDLTGVRTVAGDYHKTQLADAMNKPKLVGDIVQTWLERGEGRPTLVFAVDRPHAKALQQRFQEAGVNAGYQDFTTDTGEREEIRRDFDAGRYQVVCSVTTLTMGVDWDVRCIVMARPTKSEMLLVQMIGRGLRPKKGDPADCVLLDHSDNTLRLGFVTDIDVRHDKLDDGEKRVAEARTEALPKKCPKCQFLMPKTTRKCPNCEYAFKAPVSHIEPAEGQLVELKRHGEGTRPVSLTTREIQIGGKRTPLEQFYAQLKYIRDMRGYKPKWPDMKYKDAVGAWPPYWWFDDVEPIPASYETLSWVKAGMIRWAKRRDRA